METIILVSVLSTLGVVAIVGAVVVAFNRLGNKVDVDDFNRFMDDSYRNAETVAGDIHRRIDDVDKNGRQNIDECFRSIDSRCDKLYSEINSKKNK